MFKELKEKLKKIIPASWRHVDYRIKEVNGRIDKIDRHIIDNVDKKIGGLGNFLKKVLPPSWYHVENRFKGISDRVDEVGKRMNKALDERIEGVHERIGALGKSIDDLDKRTGELIDKADRTAEERFKVLESKIDALEQSLQKGLDAVKIVSMGTNERNFRLKLPNLSIVRELWSLAGAQTAEYVAIHMPKAKMFPDESALRAYALSMAKEGLYLEFGVYSGKTINEIAEAKPEEMIYGFDSFEGLPDDWRTGFEAGRFSMELLPDVRENVTLIKGWFEDTLPKFVREHPQKCAFVHIDCDIYASAKTVLTCLRDLIVPDTILLFDEYFNYPSWRDHEFKAFQEFVAENGVEYEYIGYVEAYEQAAVRIVNKKGNTSEKYC